MVQPLRRIADERGSVLHMLRTSDPWFSGFGEIYFSTVYPGVVKGWHYHKVQWDHFVIVHGMILRQASMVTFVTIYRMLGILFLAMIPLVLLMRRPAKGGAPAAAH